MTMLVKIEDDLCLLRLCTFCVEMQLYMYQSADTLHLLRLLVPGLL